MKVNNKTNSVKILATLCVTGNPNGEMYDDNRPRHTPSGIGVINADAIIRKIRDSYHDQDKIFLQKGCLLNEKALKTVKELKTRKAVYDQFVDLRCHGLQWSNEKNIKDQKEVFSTHGVCQVSCESVFPIKIETHRLNVSFKQNLKKKADGSVDDSTHTLGEYHTVYDELYILDITIDDDHLKSGRIDQEALDYLIYGIQNIHKTNVNRRIIHCRDLVVAQGSYAGKQYKSLVKFHNTGESDFDNKYMVEKKPLVVDHPFWDMDFEVIQKETPYLPPFVD